MYSRRRFLAGSAVGLATSAPALWRRAAAAVEPKGDLPALVIVELSGGNDGLNTIVPHADDLYAKARPTLRVDPKSVLKLDDRVGLHPALKELRRIWDEGDLAVVQGVGYPNPSRSHFRSMEIWQTGVVGAAPVAGWLGRVADENPALGACHIGVGGTPLAVRGRKAIAPTLATLADYRLAPGAVFPNRAPSGDELAREVQRRIDATRARASALEPFNREPISSPAGSLGERLAVIRALIEQDSTLRVFYTAHDGFDTHARQQYAHNELLRTVSSAIATFLADIRKAGLAERVVVLVYSEFGRRVKENAQGGTDHGAAGPVLVAGSPVRGGLLGPAPDLTHLNDGDVSFSIDFRDLYATLLRRWLSVDPTMILGPREGALPLF